MPRDKLKVFAAYGFLYVISFIFVGYYGFERLSLFNQVTNHVTEVQVQTRFYFLIVPMGFLIGHWLILLGSIVPALAVFRKNKERVVLTGLALALLAGVWVEAQVEAKLSSEQYIECVERKHSGIYTSTHFYYRNNLLCDS